MRTDAASSSVNTGIVATMVPARALVTVCKPVLKHSVKTPKNKAPSNKLATSCRGYSGRHAYRHSGASSAMTAMV